MEQDKKCPVCNRRYRGEGYKDLCTSTCWYLLNRPTKKIPKPVSKFAVTPPSTTKTPRQIREEHIQKANAEWLEKDALAPVKSRHKKNAEINMKMLFSRGGSGPGGWMKKFNAVRG